MHRIVPLLTLSLLFFLPMTSLAQEGAKSQEQEAREQAERSADRTLGWMGELNMSASQKEKVRKLLIEMELNTTRMRERQSDKIRKLLTPTQQETYDRWVKQLRQAGRRSNQQRSSQWGRLGLGPEQLEKELELSKEQQKKLQAALAKAGQRWATRWAKMQQEGSSDWRKLLRESIAEIRQEIDKFLDAKQKKKFAELNKKTDERIKAWLGAMSGRGGSRSAAGKVRELPQAKIERLVASAIEVLNCSEEEKAVLGPMIQRLVSYRVNTEARLERQGNRIAKAAQKGTSSEEKLARKVEELVKARAAFEKKLAMLEDGMRELLSRRQEYGLIGLGVLRPKR